MAVGIHLAMGDSFIGVENSFSSRPHFAISYLAFVDFHNRYYLGSGAAEKQFVGGVEFASVYLSLFDRDTEFFLGKFGDSISGDTDQYVFVTRWCYQLSIFDHVDIHGGAFCNMAVLVKDDTIVEAHIIGIGLGQGSIGVGS